MDNKSLVSHVIICSFSLFVCFCFHYPDKQMFGRFMQIAYYHHIDSRMVKRLSFPYLLFFLGVIDLV